MAAAAVARVCQSNAPACSFLNVLVGRASRSTLCTWLVRQQLLGFRPGLRGTMSSSSGWMIYLALGPCCPMMSWRGLLPLLLLLVVELVLLVVVVAAPLVVLEGQHKEEGSARAHPEPSVSSLLE